jgi:hypothetical protein
VTEPPSGQPPPVSAQLPGGGSVDLRALAQEICGRYRAEFPDEEQRYGEAGMAWCLHDNQHILNWTVTEAHGFGGLERRLDWLAGVLDARDFPLDRLARNLEIAAAVVAEALPGRADLSEPLALGAKRLRAR